MCRVFAMIPPHVERKVFEKWESNRGWRLYQRARGGNQLAKGLCRGLEALRSG
ncbi:hypothetical protein BDM02DRAFT_3123842, partial [Thelephora ganbajun]